MKPYQQRMSPVIERMVGDMKIRNLSPATIDAYTYHIQRFAAFLNKPLEKATPDEVRDFQLHLIEEQKVGWSSFNQAVCGLRFLYTHTHHVPWPVTMVPFGKRPRLLPTVLSVEEVDALLQCTVNLKQRTFLMTLYAAGVRLAEAAALRIPDIDSRRMQLNVALGKGSKSRRVPLSPRLLEALRTYWRAYRPTHYLFPGQHPERPYAANVDSEGHQGCGPQGRDSQAGHAPRAAAFLCHGTLGSGSRSVNDQSRAGTRQLQHDDGLSACAASPSGFDPQSPGLAARATTAAVGTAGQDARASHLGKLTVAEILRDTAALYIQRFPGRPRPRCKAR